MISAQCLTKQFGDGTYGVLDIELEIKQGEFVFLMGSSGAGKTTLLNLLIGKYKPTAGDLTVADINLAKIKAKHLFKLRRKLGMVFQDFKILEDRTIYENIALAYQVQGKKEKHYKEEISDLLNRVGLPGKERYFPIQLSGGELQRVAIARAMAGSPQLLIADEPTGDLDWDTSWEIMELFSEMNAQGVTILMATHNHMLVEKMKKRVVLLENGKIDNDTGATTHHTKHHKKTHADTQEAQESAVTEIENE